MGYAYPPQYQDLLSGCACAIIFILLIALDGWKAIKRKSYWFPGTFLVLSALTLQFINYVDYSTVNITSGITDITDEDVENVLKVQLVIDSGRLVICVFVAYLLPGLASSGFRSVWADLGALTLNVLSHMFSEIYLVMYISDQFPTSAPACWFELFSCTVLIAIILLVLLSISAVVAGKTIDIMMNEKVSSLLQCCSNSPTGCGNCIGNHVLKCWIIVRCSQPEDVVARSVLTSFAGSLLALCISLFAVKWGFVYIDDYKRVSPLNKTTLVLQFIFVLIGWILVSVRWLRAQIYFPIHGRNLFHVEDFWTRCILDLKYGQLKAPLFRETRYRNRTVLENNIMDLIIQFKLHSLLLRISFLVQIIIVLFSKLSSFFSWIMLWPLLMIVKKIMLFCGSHNQDSEFSGYRDLLEEIRDPYRDLLEKIRMPGEMAENLWKANESAFKSTWEHMQKGRYSTAAMTAIITRHLRERAAVGGEETKAEEEKYFKYVGKRSWKIEAVSLVHLMVSLYDYTNSGVVDEAMRACSEAWPLMDFVETSDTEVNLLSLAADKEFHTIENKWKKMKSANAEKMRSFRDRMKDDIESRICEGESQKRKRVDNIQDSMDWIRAAANFSLKKASQSVGYPTSSNPIDKSSSILACVIVDCLAEARNKAIIEKCNKWTVEGKEEEIYHAAFIAGKAMSAPETLQTTQESNGVPPAVATGNGNSAVSPAVAAENGNNATVADGEGNEENNEEALDTFVDTIGGAIEAAGQSGGDNNC